MKVFLVFGSDLAHEKGGRVVLGSDTMKACDTALSLCLHAGHNSAIIATAGIAPLMWNQVWMADLMIRYIRDKHPKIGAIAEKADSFNTFGEAKKFAEVVSSLHRPKVSQAVIVAKEWHMNRAKMLCNHWFQKVGLNIPITSEEYESPAGILTLIRERLATVNARRMIVTT